MAFAKTCGRKPIVRISFFSPTYKTAFSKQILLLPKYENFPGCTTYLDKFCKNFCIEKVKMF
jgi:hypothetical protein